MTEPSIQLKLSCFHLHLLLKAVGHLPRGPDAIAVEKLLQDALSPPVGNSLPTLPLPLPISTTLGDDVHTAINDAEIDRELLALTEDDLGIEPRHPVSANSVTQGSDQTEANVTMADNDAEVTRELLRSLGEESESDSDSPDSPPSPDAHGFNLFQPGPHCARGGKKLQKHTGVAIPAHTDPPAVTPQVYAPEPRFVQTENTAPSGNHTAHSFIASLAGACVDKATIWAEELKHNVAEWQYVGDSLTAAIRKCQNTTCSNFAIILGHIQLVMKCQSLINSTVFKDINDIFTHMVEQLQNPPSRSSFYRWVQIGHKFSHLANGGSFYILVLIAALDLRTAAAGLEAQVPWDVGKMLREPEACRTPNLIKDHIIPLLERLRQLMPIMMGPGMFCPDFVQQYDLPVYVDCTDLATTDKVFGCIKHRGFTLPERDGKAWLTWIESPIVRGHLIVGDTFPVSRFESNQQGSLPLPHQLDGHTQTRTSFKIGTNFDRNHKENKRHPNGRVVGRANLEWTQHERHLARQASVVLDLYHLREKLNCFYPNGFKIQGSYLRVPVRQMPPGTIEIRNSDDSLMVFVSSEMPPSLKKTLAESLVSAFDGEAVLASRDTSKGAPEQFESVHYAVYNRYSIMGTGAPPEIHPHRLQLFNKRTNHVQMVPYASAETFEHRERYHKLLQAFNNTFVWVTSLMAYHLPEDFKVLMTLSESLPGGYEAPVPPFLSLVVNLNIRSEAHRDPMDKNVCLVIPIGDFKGGELVLVEQGLVLELGSGDVVVFRSGEATHFNQDYEGKRASFVLHTDRNMDTWQEHNNYWGGNHYFN